MNRASPILACVSLLGVAGTASATGVTLNFDNVTQSRVVQTVAEVAMNEKEVEPGDYDNDGDLDVVIAVAHSDFGQRRNKLYNNDGGVFTEVSAEVPLFLTGQGDVARNAFFRDYNGDGWLDIIVVCDNNTTGDPGRTKLWINLYSGGVHTGWSEEGVLRLGSSTGGAACGAVSVDNDGDGDTDLYVGNYPGPSQDTMYFNNGSGFFTAMTGTHVPADSDYTVDVSSADLNGDGQLDLLVSNGFSDTCWAYYNNNNGAGSGEGDYRYTGSQQSLLTAASETAMEPGDFDGDGDVDFYWANKVGGADRVYRNSGNNGSGLANFTELSGLPPSVVNVTSRKASVADLDGDGDLDIFVMKEAAAASRPTILRNVTFQADDIRFIDWTPAPTFPAGNVHMGWHAAVFDSNGDGDLDVFLGGWANDHLFEQVPGVETTEAAAGGVISGLYNLRPVGLTGSAGEGESDTYAITGLGAAAFLSVILNGADDYLLEILDAGGGVLTTVNRGGLGVEEAIQYDPPGDPAMVQVRITVLDAAPAAPQDIDGDGNVGINDLLQLLASWGPCPGCPADVDGDGSVGINDLLDVLAAWGPVVGAGEYVLELLSRSG